MLPSIRLWLLGSAIAVLLAFSWPADDARGETPTISLVPPPTAAIGDTISVLITVQGGTNVAAFEAEVGFDPLYVSFVSAEVGPYLSSTGRTTFCPAPQMTERRIIFGCSTLGTEPAPPSGDGVLATLRFVTLRSGVHIFFAPFCELADVLGQPQLVSCVSGTITITPGTATLTATPTAHACSVGPLLPGVIVTSHPCTATPAVPPLATSTPQPPPGGGGPPAATATLAGTSTPVATSTPAVTSSPAATSSPIGASGTTEAATPPFTNVVIGSPGQPRTLPDGGTGLASGTNQSRDALWLLLLLPLGAATLVKLRGGSR